MFIRWNRDCNTPIGNCDAQGEYDELVFVEGDIWILPQIDGTVSLYDTTAGVNLGVISSAYSTSPKSFFEFQVTNIKPDSILRLGTILNCAANCSGIVQRSSFPTDFAFLDSFASLVASLIGVSYFVFSATNTIRIFLPDNSSYCGATLTVNNNFSNNSNTCLLPNITGDCQMPVVITERAGICSSTNKCLNMIQIQGFNVCLAAIRQPICAKGARTELNFPINLNHTHCFKLLLTGDAGTFCSQPLRIVCDECYTSLIRARNFNEHEYRIRLAMYPHSKQMNIEGENTKNSLSRIRKLYSTQETVYTLTTDYYYPDIHFALAELLQKDFVAIYYNYELYEPKRWEAFVLLDRYEIKYNDSQPKNQLAQGEAKLIVHNYSYTNFNC
jgi:hypothetical protein